MVKWNWKTTKINVKHIRDYVKSVDFPFKITTALIRNIAC